MNIKYLRDLPSSYVLYEGTCTFYVLHVPQVVVLVVRSTVSTVGFRWSWKVIFTPAKHAAEKSFPFSDLHET